MPPNRFEVDLTSVCVRRGALQLPYRLQGAFEEGSVAAVDADGGALVELRFRPPRELVGLQPFFEAHGLRANDRIGLVFTEQGLRVEAIRRERKLPGRAATGTAPAPAAGEPRERGRERQPGTRANAAPAAPPDAAHGQPSRSAASSAPPSLRMAAPAPSEPVRERSPEAPGEAPSAPRWEPLDVTASQHASAASASAGPEDATSDAVPSPRVREIRRGAPLLPPSAPAEGHADPGQGAATMSRADPGDRVAERRPDDGGRADPAAGNAPSRGRDLFGLRRRLGLVRGEGAGGRAGAPARAEGRQDAAGPATPPRRSGQPPSGQPQSGRARPEPAPGVPSAGRPASDESAPDQSAPLESAPYEAAPGRLAAPTEWTSHAGPVAESGAGRAPETAVASASEGAAAGSGEEDRASVQAYLGRPDVPAIVRAERVAEALGLSVERADAALDRISEASDHLSRIRAGAYMLRRRSDD